jgi:hypothetical protein
MKTGGILGPALAMLASGELQKEIEQARSETEFEETIRRHLMYRPAYTVIPDWQKLH